jgi:uncharacterized protein (DUF885 family)
MRLPTAFLLVAALAGCAGARKHGASSPAAADSARLAALVDRYFEELLVLNPVLATMIGDDRYDDQLPNFYAPEYRARLKALSERYLAELGGLDRASLHGQDRLSYDVLEHDLRTGLEGLRFPDWLLPVHQFSSPPAFLALLGSGKVVQPFRTVKDYDAFLGRMARIAPVLDQAMPTCARGSAPASSSRDR